MGKTVFGIELKRMMSMANKTAATLAHVEANLGEDSMTVRLTTLRQAQGDKPFGKLRVTNPSQAQSDKPFGVSG